MAELKDHCAPNGVKQSCAQPCLIDLLFAAASANVKDTQGWQIERGHVAFALSYGASPVRLVGGHTMQCNVKVSGREGEWLD